MENNPLSRIAHGSYFLILDQAVNYGLGALFWIVLAKLLDPTLIGQAMVVIAFMTAILGFTGYGAQVTISKYVAEYRARKMFSTSRKVLNLGLRVGLIVSGCAALVFGLLSNQIATTFYQDSSLATLIAIGILALLPSQTIMYCFNGAYQGSQRMKFTTIADVIYQSARISIAVALAIIGLGSFGIILGLVLGSIVAVFAGYRFFIPRLFTTTSISVESSNLKAVVRFSGLNYLSIGISTLALQVNYLLLGMQSFDSVAFFGLALLFSQFAGVVLASVGKAVIPTTSEEWIRKNKRDLSKALNTAFRISLMLSGLLYIVLIVAPDLVLSLLSREYVAAAPSLRILVLAQIIVSMSMLIMAILNGRGKPDKVARISVISSSAMIALSLALVPLFGVEGAASSVFLASLVSISLALYYIKKEKELLFSYWNIIKPIISVSIAIFIGYMTLMGVENVILAISLSFGAYLGLIRVFRVTTNAEIRTLMQFATKILRPKKK